MVVQNKLLQSAGDAEISEDVDYLIIKRNFIFGPWPKKSMSLSTEQSTGFQKIAIL